MSPSSEFWAGVGHGISQSPWWAVLGVLLLISAFIIVARYIVPSRERIKMRELDIREREAENDRSRIEANKSLAEQTRSCRESVDLMATQVATQSARLGEYVSQSSDMGKSIERIDSTTSHTDDLVSDIHRKLIASGGRI